MCKLGLSDTTGTYGQPTPKRIREEMGKGAGRGRERERNEGEAVRVKERRPVWARLRGTLLVVYKVLS